MSQAVFRRIGVLARVAFVLAIFCVVGLCSPGLASIVLSGYVEPGLAGDWNSSTDGYIGKNGTGSATVNGGDDLYCKNGCIGYIGDGYTSASGEVTIDGAGSTWTNAGGLSVGQKGSATLDILNGAVVTSNANSHVGQWEGSTGIVTIDGASSQWNNTGILYVGYYGHGTLDIIDGSVSVVGSVVVDLYPTATGTIHFGPTGGSLNATSLYAVPTHLTGTGTITTQGLVSDTDLVFDSDHPTIQTLTFNQSGQNITTYLDVSGGSGTVGDVGAGYQGNGSLTIEDGRVVNAKMGYLGHNPGSTGTATVDGVGSAWNHSSTLNVGYFGNGTLDITHGGTVSSAIGYVGYSNSSAVATGVVTVHGVGSAWTNSSLLCIGNYGKGNGTLNILGHATVSNTTGYIGKQKNSIGSVTVDGLGSTWINSSDLYVGGDGRGTLTITDGGLVRVGGTLTINSDGLNNDGLINMAYGGMLALLGDGDNSLAAFLGLVEGSDKIQWWNQSINNWALLTTATLGTDYTLEYYTAGDLSGYTLLTVGDTPIPGDANRNGIVDGSDATILAGYWQYGVNDDQTATWAMGDFNADGTVDGSDATILAGYWQMTNNTSTAVPEPTTGMLLSALLLAAGVGVALKKRG